MKTLKVLAVVAVTGLVGLTAVNACPMGGEKMHEGMKQKKAQMKGLFMQLDLTSEQKSQMKALRQEMKAQHKERKSAMIKGRGMAKMGQFVSANGFDRQGFTAMATKKSQTMIAKRADMFEKRMNILTPEQRVKLVSLMQEK
jgi:protein CpxP